MKNRCLAAINKDLLTTDAILRDVKDIPDELAVQIQQVSNNPKVAGQMIVRNGEVVKLTSYNLGKNPLTPSNTDGKYDKIDIEELAESISQQLFENVMETASTNQGGAGEMENVYQKLIDRLDQDIRDHKQEVRDRDAKWQAEILKREEFYRSESKEREQRIIKAFDDLKNDFKDVKNDVRESSKHIRNLSITSIVAMITTIAAIAGIAITVYFSTFPQ